MTKIKLRMVTSLSGTMGDTTYRTLSPGNIVVSDKAALPTFENEEDKTARDARADQFGAVNALVPSVIDAVKKGFPNKPRGVSAANMFTARNAATLCVSTPAEDGGFAREYDFRSMRLSEGPVDAPSATAAVVAASANAEVDTESRAVSFTLAALPPEEETSLCKATDEVYAFVFDGELRKGALVELGARGDGGSKTFSIPESWSTADLYVYAFARARRGRKASPTALLYPAE